MSATSIYPFTHMIPSAFRIDRGIERRLNFTARSEQFGSVLCFQNSQL